MLAFKKPSHLMCFDSKTHHFLVKIYDKILSIQDGKHSTPCKSKAVC